MALTPPFAVLSDLTEAMGRSLSTAEETRAAALLRRASQMIIDEDRRGVLASLTEPTPSLIDTACAMVERAMASPVAGAGVESTTQTMGPFSESQTYANPSGDLYLTAAERRRLGLSRQRAGGVDMWSPPVA